MNDRSNWVDFLQILVGVFLASVGLKVFLLPNGFLDGGVTGIAILLSKITEIEISYWLIFMSIPFLILGAYSVSRKIVIRSFFTILLLAFAIHFEEFTPITEDLLLVCIFGGLLLGAGIGLTIKCGAVLDGSEILGIFIHDRYGISIGRVILAFNVVLFAITAFVFTIEIAMYSILTYLVTAKTIDFIIEGFDDYVGLMVISSKSETIEQDLLQKSNHGITVYQGKRGYGNRGVQHHTEILHLVINRIDIKRTYSIIQACDPQAFIIEFDINSVTGGKKRKILGK